MKKNVVGLCALLLIPALGSSAPQDGLEAIVADIKRDRDEVDPARLEQLAELGTRQAMEATVETYDLMASIYMRLEVVRALAKFDGVEDAAQPALQKIADVATSSPEPELRDGALQALGACPEFGKHYLELIVDSPADDKVREQAMGLHAARFDEASDVEWYKKVFESKEWQERKKSKSRKGDETPREAVPLAKVRELALEKIAHLMDVSDLVEAAEEKERDDNDLRKDGIRRIALQELFRRADKKAYKVAQDVYKDVTEKAANRVLAAKILYTEKADKVAGMFLEDGRKLITPLQVANALADLLVEMDHEATNRKLLKLVGKGKAAEKLFVLRAVRRIEDEDLDLEIAKLLTDQSRDVAMAAARTLGERRAAETLPQLEAVLETAKDELLLAVVIDTITSLASGDEWNQRLVELFKHSPAGVRNAALIQLGKKGGFTDTLIEALDDPDWSMRRAAIEALEAERTARATGAIVARMQKEDGRLLFACADALWRLTGQPYRTKKESWKAWWDEQGAGFQPITLEALAEREKDEEMRRLRQISRTAPNFFGIKVESRRVLYIIDVSGSMNWDTRSQEVGTERIVIAKRELQNSIDSLEQGALFNIIIFSSDVSYWLDGGVSDSKQASRDEAKEFIERLGAGGGTNLYGALKAGFTDPDVDTIFVLSDGEPSVGEVTDPGAIREDVAFWNEHRGIKINTIAIGGSFDILEWLAEDSGGTHVRIP
jgi:HEAT repeat protein